MPLVLVTESGIHLGEQNSSVSVAEPGSNGAEVDPGHDALAGEEYPAVVVSEFFVPRRRLRDPEGLFEVRGPLPLEAR